MNVRDGSIDGWMDYLIKRWPIVVAVIGLIVGVLKTQWVQNAQAEDLKMMRDAINEYSDIKAEWPYLKKRVEDVNVKVDKIDDKLDILLRRP